MDGEGKIGGYDNTAAIAFFDKYKNGDVSLFFFFFTFGIKNKKKLELFFLIYLIFFNFLLYK